MHPRSLPRVAPLAALALALAAPAQSLALDKSGGGIGDAVRFQMQGPADALYLLLFALSEQATPVPALGITLAIPGDFAPSAIGVPGFLGNLDSSGAAAASLPIPNVPGLAGLTVPFQAIAANGPVVVSNLIRVTAQMPGTFALPLGQPLVPIAGGGTAAAPDGQVLFVGGSGPVAQRYQSRTGDWAQAGATLGVGLFSQTTGLPDGRVLFTGGLDPLTGQPTAAAAVYDPVAQTTTALSMGTARAAHGASVMGNGRVLITGGMSSLDLANPLSLFTGLLASTEIFDPATGSFAPGPTMLEPRGMHSSTTLTNGNVLIAGGLSLLPIVNLPNVSATAYRFNPATNSFGLPATFAGGRFLHSAVPLSNGKVLLCGGVSLDLGTFLTSGNVQDLVVGTRTDCQLFTVGLFGFGTFATVDGMQEGRAGAAVAPLPNGGALIAGGFQLTLDITHGQFVFQPTASADRFAQGPNLLAPTGAMAAPRMFPITANLPDGRILIAGGGAAVEVYQQ